MSLPILILAAGASTRMEGRDKLLETVGGMPLLRHRAQAALATGAEVFVTLPANPARLSVLEGLAVTPVPSDHHAEGMAGSLRDGLCALPASASGVMILLADMPEITTRDMRLMLDQFDGTPLRGATADGLPGHPVLLPRGLFDDVAALRGDAGARVVLAGRAIRLIPLPDRHAVTDLDTPQDWADWRGH